ncbi:MAG: FAD-dependent oxidoreductase [Candidatus Zixiibacteriota bacterium]|nr:MAG: FAD-dependent oxidoreductase [candidate division Zixibacteria bacterium]
MVDIDHSNYVIIGGVAAGPKTAASLARRLPKSKITLFQKEDLLSYGSCGLPFFASGDLNSIDELVVTSYGVPRDADFFRKVKGFEAITGAEIIRIDRAKKTVAGKLIGTGETFLHRYDKLVLATGSVPARPPFPVAKSPAIRYFTRPDDAVHFRRQAEQGKIGKAVVIGGGLIGCEVIQACADLWGIETTLIEIQDQLLPYVLDADMAAIVRREIAGQNIEVLTGIGVERITLNDAGQPVVFIPGYNPITADYVFLCLGVRPQSDLAGDCGLQLGKTGAISVNEFMQTSDQDIYAGGDCAESIHQITGEKLYIPMGSLANRHGRVIADHIAGVTQPFPGVLGAFFVKIYGCNVGAVGLSEAAARKAGLAARAVWGTFPDKPDYYPEYRTFVLKMIYDNVDRRLLGLQAVGTGDICRRIDVFSAFLQHRATINDLLDFEHGYAPPYSEALDPLHHLAGIAEARQDGLDIIGAGSVIQSEIRDAVWLDVRETDEVESQPLPAGDVDHPESILNIPLKQLRDRVKEFDPDKRIFIVCKRGVRSYQAACILKAAGIRNVTILGGGVQALQ